MAHVARFIGAGPASAPQHLFEFNDKPVASVKSAFKATVGLAGIDKRVSPHTAPHRSELADAAPRRSVEAAGYLGMSLDVLLNTYGHSHPDDLSRAKITRPETKPERTADLSGAVRRFPPARR